MWWDDIALIAERVKRAAKASRIDATATIEPGAVIDDSAGPVVVGPRSRLCAGARVRGPVVIGSDCLVGNHAMLRGPLLIGDGVRIGFATEIKQAAIADRVSIGPLCFVADSRVDEDAYLGALVRTSNHRLDGQQVSVRDGDREILTGMDKLGCWIGARASLGIQVIVLPGRVVAADTMFEPRVTVARNYPTGRYRVQQVVERV